MPYAMERICEPPSLSVLGSLIQIGVEILRTSECDPRNLPETPRAALESYIYPGTVEGRIAQQRRHQGIGGRGDGAFATCSRTART